MRIVILGSGLYSETGCAMAAHLAECGHVPVGALVLATLDRKTLLRKLAQWGARDVAFYARTKLIPHRDEGLAQLRNPYLAPFLKQAHRVVHSLREVAARYDFPIAICSDQNSLDSITRVRQWSPDLIVFTGGNILRKPLLKVPGLGVLNVHLGLLPEIRGMSSPEWSLLKQVPVGVTIHYLDAGIDTGPVLKRFEFPDAARCKSLIDLRNRLVAFGLEKMAEVVSALDRGAISATPQCNLYSDNQHFVMHEWLQARAMECLSRNRVTPVAETLNG